VHLGLQKLSENHLNDGFGSGTLRKNREKDTNMPVINLEIGQVTTEQKRQLAKELTETAARITGIKSDAFYVFIQQHADENIGIGGTLVSDRDRK
jgi:4-oxalocrotonate tautomerase